MTRPIADRRARPYKAEDGGSSPSAPTIGDNILRACYALSENDCGHWVREKSVRCSSPPSTEAG